MIDAPLPPVLRRARILERVQRDGGATLADLASEHAVSPVTVHRDLELLSGEGLLERVRGGARSLPDARPRIETAWNARVREAAREKDAIAAHARELVEDGSTIFVDASSTGLALARALELQPPTELTLVTNSPAIALGLTADTIHVIVPPGELNQHMRVLTGRWTVEFLAELNIAVAFISAAGVTLEHGLTTSRSGARGHAERGRGRGGEDRRAARLVEVQALVAADRAQRPVAGPDHHRRRAGRGDDRGVPRRRREPRRRRPGRARRADSLRNGRIACVCVRSSRRRTGACSGPASLSSGNSRAALSSARRPGRVHERELGQVDPDRATLGARERGFEDRLAHQVELAAQAQHDGPVLLVDGDVEAWRTEGSRFRLGAHGASSHMMTNERTV